MQCCVRTENDKKGGHLAKRESDGQLILRESAMCADEDTPHFQNIEKYKYFNTNNLWIRLDKLKEIVDKFGGFVPLPMIKNKKTVDPKNSESQKVFQLETAMGGEIIILVTINAKEREGRSFFFIPLTFIFAAFSCN